MLSSTTTLYFVRHGQVHNPTEILYGRMKRYRLSAEGTKQIAKTAAFLRNKNITKIFSSPLLRTRQTSRIIQKHLGIPYIHTSTHLLEIKSPYEGRSLSYLQTIGFDFYSGITNNRGETKEDIVKRMLFFIERLRRKHGGQKVVAVSHGDPIMLLYAHILDLPPTLTSIRTDYVSYGEVFEVTVDPHRHLSIKRIYKPTT